MYFEFTTLPPRANPSRDCENAAVVLSITSSLWADETRNARPPIMSTPLTSIARRRQPASCQRASCRISAGRASSHRSRSQLQSAPRFTCMMDAMPCAWPVTSFWMNASLRPSLRRCCHCVRPRVDALIGDGFERGDSCGSGHRLRVICASLRNPV